MKQLQKKGNAITHLRSHVTNNNYSIRSDRTYVNAIKFHLKLFYCENGDGGGGGRE